MWRSANARMRFKALQDFLYRPVIANYVRYRTLASFHDEFDHYEGDGFLLMSADNTQSDRKTYESPNLNKLTPKEAHLLLESQAVQGDEAAKDLLDLLSPAELP